MIDNLEDAVLVLWDANDIREDFKQKPDPESSVTEESIWASLRVHGESSLDVVRYSPMYTRALRLMLGQVIDPQG